MVIRDSGHRCGIPFGSPFVNIHLSFVSKVQSGRLYLVLWMLTELI